MWCSAADIRKTRRTPRRLPARLERNGLHRRGENVGRRNAANQRPSRKRRGSEIRRCESRPGKSEGLNSSPNPILFQWRQRRNRYGRNQSRNPASHRKGSDKKWSGKVKTVSTYPPEGLYTKDAETIARVMATKKVSPKGIGSAIRMVQFSLTVQEQLWPRREGKSWRRRKPILQAKK